MDTSEKYIKMCEKAWQYLKWEGIKKGQCPPEKSPIWRQDQLQEMFKIDCEIIHQKNGTVEIFFYDEIIGNHHHIFVNTIEQGLLIAGMNNKYNKIWDDTKEEWIKCNG